MSVQAARGRGGDASSVRATRPRRTLNVGRGGMRPWSARGALWERSRYGAAHFWAKPRRSAWRKRSMAARNELRLQRCSPSDLFRAVFCACGDEKVPLVIDVRPKAAFARGHVAGAYCVRTSANGAALLDYSGGGQARPWAPGAWHDAPLLLLAAGGDDDDPPLDKRHPVAAFLIAEGAARSLAVVRGGCEARARLHRRRAASDPCLPACSFAAVLAEYPFVCGGGCTVTRYPSEVVPRQLFLGDWSHAEDHAVLRQLRISHLLTIHNVRAAKEAHAARADASRWPTDRCRGPCVHLRPT